MDEADLVRVHEAGIAHHVAAVGQVDGQHRAAAILHRRRAVVVQLFIVVGRNVAAGKDVFQVLREIGVDRHHVFEVAVLRAILHHQDLAVALDDGGLDLADLFVHQNFVRQFAVEDLLPDFRDTLRAQRISRPRPAERRLRLFVGLQQRLVGPFRGGRWVLLDLIQTIENRPSAFGGDGDCFLYVLDRLVHVSSRLLAVSSQLL